MRGPDIQRDALFKRFVRSHGCRKTIGTPSRVMTDAALIRVHATVAPPPCRPGRRKHARLIRGLLSSADGSWVADVDDGIREPAADRPHALTSLTSSRADPDELAARAKQIDHQSRPKPCRFRPAWQQLF